MLKMIMEIEDGWGDRISAKLNDDADSVVVELRPKEWEGDEAPVVILTPYEARELAKHMLDCAKRADGKGEKK